MEQMESQMFFFRCNKYSPYNIRRTFNLDIQDTIIVENVNCTNAQIVYQDSTNPIGVPGVGVGTSNWDFDFYTNSAVPATGVNNPDTTTYGSVERYSILHSTATNGSLDEYRGFHNIAFDKAFKPDILSSANLLSTDTFQLCEGEFATFSSSIFGDTTRWEFNGAIINPGNVQNVPSTQFNIPGFYQIELFLITDCCGDTPIDTVWLYVDPVPTPVSSPDVAICEGDITFLFVTGVSPTDSIVWTPTLNMIVIRPDSILVYPTSTTTYTASVYSIVNTNGQDRLSCPTSSSINVTVNPLPNPAMSSNAVICVNDGSARATPPPGIYNFTWSNGVTETGEASSTISNLSDQIYCVTVTDQATGCVDTSCINVAPSSTVINGFASRQMQ